jgi:hypothetical protein
LVIRDKDDDFISFFFSMVSSIEILFSAKKLKLAIIIIIININIIIISLIIFNLNNCDRERERGRERGNLIFFCYNLNYNKVK